jgi:AraC-like DNA-binding protein
MHETPRFLFAGIWEAAAGQHAPGHRQSGWKVTYYRRGRIESIVDGVRHAVAAGDALVLPPHAVHEEIALTAYTDLYLVLDAPADHPWPTTMDADTAHEVGWLLGAILREQPRRDEADSTMPALLEVLDTTLRRTDPRQRPSSAAEVAVRAAETLFEEQYAGSVSIAAVARQVRVSPSSLRAYFTALRGIPPQEVLQRVRLRHTLTLLRTSDLTLAAIAERCGFHSASHLSRHVKAETGFSPGSLRA